MGASPSLSAAIPAARRRRRTVPLIASWPAVAPIVVGATAGQVVWTHASRPDRFRSGRSRSGGADPTGRTPTAGSTTAIWLPIAAVTPRAVAVWETCNKIGGIGGRHRARAPRRWRPTPQTPRLQPAFRPPGGCLHVPCGRASSSRETVLPRWRGQPWVAGVRCRITRPSGPFETGPPPPPGAGSAGATDAARPAFGRRTRATCARGRPGMAAPPRGAATRAARRGNASNPAPARTGSRPATSGGGAVGATRAVCRTAPR